MDLIIEDTQAEEIERVRARKEGSARWNEDEPRVFLYVIVIHPDVWSSMSTRANSGCSKAFPGPDEGEQIREGFEPSELPAASHGDSDHERRQPSSGGNDDYQSSGQPDQLGDDRSSDSAHKGKEAQPKFSDERQPDDLSPFNDERSAWGSSKDSKHV